MVNKKEKYVTNGHKMPVILGYDENGGVITDDIVRMPHLLIGGCTGSGKSVFLMNIINQLTLKFTPKELRLVLIDLKKTQFVNCEEFHAFIFDNVVTDIKNAVEVLHSLVSIMEERSNASISKTEIPRIVVIIDEAAELMWCSEEARELITLLTAQAHRVGIHFIVASQTAASTEAVPETLKENFNTRAVFKMFDKIDSISILGESEAEWITRPGEMLYKSYGLQGVKKVRVPYKEHLEWQIAEIKGDLNG